MTKKTMEKPEFLGLEAIVCITDPIAAAVVFGAAGAEAIGAAAAVCNLPAVVPVAIGGSMIS